VGRHIVGQHQKRSVAASHEIAGHGKHEIGVGAIHLFEEGSGLLHRDVGAAFDEHWRPTLDVILVE